MLFQIGRVDFDPLRVPTAAAMSPDRDGTFAERLEAATAGRREPRDDRARPTEHDAEPTQLAASEEARPEALPPAEDAPEPALPPERAEAPVAAAGQLPARGEPDRHIGTGKGPDSPLAPFVREASARAEREATAQDAPPTASPRQAFVPAGVPAQAVAQPLTTTVGGDRIGATAAIGATGATRTAAAATAAATGYRTWNNQSVQLAEQARDSVFKQILFKLDADRSEMRLRLDPPELGELDLHLTVEKGGQLRLSIGVERGDLAAAMRQDLGRLEHALQERGLQVVHTEVHARTGGDGRPHGDTPHGRGNGSGSDDHDEAAIGALRRGGWVTAQGLDFWV